MDGAAGSAQQRIEGAPGARGFGRFAEQTVEVVVREQDRVEIVGELIEVEVGAEMALVDRDPCGVGEGCMVDADCASGLCQGIVCAVACATDADGDGYVSASCNGPDCNDANASAHPGALEQCDQIAAIDGVDMLFVGPSDLSQVLGVIGQFDSRALWDAYNRVAAACKKHGKNWGTFPAGLEFAEKCVAKGCRMLSLGADTHCLKRGIEAMQAVYPPFFSKSKGAASIGI